MWATVAIVFGVFGVLAVLLLIGYREERRARTARMRLIQHTTAISDQEFDAGLNLRAEETRLIGRAVREILAHQMGLPKHTIHPDSSFQDLWGTQWDGGDSVELVMALEERFGIAIPDKHSKDILTVRHLVDYIVQAVAHGKPTTAGPADAPKTAAPPGFTY